MFNSQRIELIRKNIQASTLLTDKEKSDWLNLLDLMNDKQLGELEEILAAESPDVNFTEPAPLSSAPIGAANGIDGVNKPQPPVQQMPPLSHLANVPSGMGMNQPASTPIPTPLPSPIQTSAPAAPTTQRAPAPIPAPAPRPAPLPVPPSPSYPKPQPKPEPMARPTPSPNLSVPPSPTLARPTEQPPARILNPLPTPDAATNASPANSPTPAAPSTPTPGQGTYSINQLEDLQLLSPDILRTMSQQSIFDTIKSVIAVNGYFAVLQLIESSPLFVAYIKSGNIRLGVQVNGAEEQAELSQEEFEFVTDLLRNMRFNRW